MRRIAAGLAAGTLACFLAAAPAAAECNTQPNRFPSFESVAPTADTIVIATVTELMSDLPTDAAWFKAHVDERLRGDESDTIEIQRLRSGLPLTGDDSCRDNAVVYVGLGDVIALALDGNFDGHHHLNAVAWLSGRPAAITFPHAETITAARVRALVATLPPTSAAEIVIQDADEPAPFFAALGAVLGCLTAAAFVRRRRLPAVRDP